MSIASWIMLGIMAVPFSIVGLMYLIHMSKSPLKCGSRSECIYSSCGSYHDENGKVKVAMVCGFCGHRKDVTSEEANILHNISFEARHRRFGVSLGGRDE